MGKMVLDKNKRERIIKYRTVAIKHTRACSHRIAFYSSSSLSLKFSCTENFLLG